MPPKPSNFGQGLEQLHTGLGARGHLNADSSLGDGPQGWELVARWRGG